jgi:hypothetical protein
MARRRRALGVVTAVAALAAGALAVALAPPGSAGAAPRAPAFVWTAPQAIAHRALIAIRCPAPSFCVAIDRAGNVLTTSAPSSGATGWRSAHLDRALTALACPSRRLCVAVDFNGYVLTSRDPAGGAKTWTRTLVDTVSPRELSAVACRPHLCVTGDNQGNVFTATNATGGRQAWNRISLPSNGDSPGTISGFSCPVRSLCVGVDQSSGEGFIDDVFTSTHPAAAHGWNLTKEFNHSSFTAVACPTRSLCVAPTVAGEVMTATTPTRRSAWHAATLESNVPINAVACPSLSLCVLGDGAGRVETSTSPAAGAASWTAQTVAANDPLESVACPTVRLCLVGTRNGRVIVGRVGGVAGAATSGAGAAGAGSATGNRARASAEAAVLLGELALPAGAVASASEPAGDGGVLARPSYDEATPNLVDAHAWWTVPGSAADVLAYVAAYLPPGAKFSGSSAGNAGPGFKSENFALAAVPGVLSERVLAVTVVQLTSTTTAVRTDGEAVWITPRPVWEQIPPSSRSVIFTARGVTTGGREGPTSAPRMLTGVRARRLIAFIDALGLVQPGARPCPAGIPVSVQLRFFAAGGGKPVARAVEEPTGCAFVTLTVGGRAGPALTDYPSVTVELERLGAIPVCSASQLEPSASVAARSGGQALMTFTFRNRSRAVCRLSGFPRLALFDVHGHLLHHPVADQGAAIVRRQGLDAAAALDPQRSASFTVMWAGCHTPRAVRARIELPGVPARFVLGVGSPAKPFAPCPGAALGVGNLVGIP